MAYLRWGTDSDWYVFWETTPAKAKTDERLAIWNADVRDQQFGATYSQVRMMLESGDFTTIPGYVEHHHAIINEALAAFVDDVDLEYKRNSRS